MRATLWIFVALAGLLAGCGSGTTVVGANGEKATISNNGQSVTATDSQGNTATYAQNGNTATYSDSKGNTATIDKNGQAEIKQANGDSAKIGASVSESDLGVPFYPGSVEKPNASMTSTENGETTVVSNRTSKDDPAKVGSFYKDKIKDPKDSTVNASGMNMETVTGKLDDGSEISVVASKNNSDDTQIMVSVKHPKK
ncbi:MAG TPA: hypothetical protein VMI31_19255 [Fimbriimonadaceae bacterium]|nr:hypothetical protein [Fimbriimonadaceae bacterium]